MKTYLEFINENKNSIILYHGTHDKHEFDSNHRYTFFSTSKNEAMSYGKFLFEINLKPNLKLFDTYNINDLKLLFNNFDELYDDYYRPDEEEYYIKTPEQLYDSNDTWCAIEHTDGVIDWLEQYDGVWVYEGGVKNLMLFNPIKDKVYSIQEISVNIKESLDNDYLESEISKPKMFSYTAYRLPTNEDLVDINSHNLTADKILSGFWYTIVGRGIMSSKNKNMIIDSIQMLCDKYPDNLEYKNALEQAKEIKSKWS